MQLPSLSEGSGDSDNAMQLPSWSRGVVIQTNIDCSLSKCEIGIVCVTKALVPQMKIHPIHLALFYLISFL